MYNYTQEQLEDENFKGVYRCERFALGIIEKIKKENDEKC